MARRCAELGSKLSVEGMVSKQIGKPYFPGNRGRFQRELHQTRWRRCAASEAADDLDDAGARKFRNSRKKVASVAALIENAIRSTKQRDQGRVPSPLIERDQSPNLIHRSHW